MGNTIVKICLVVISGLGLITVVILRRSLNESPVKAEKTKKHAARFKIPFLDWYIVSGVDLRADDKKFEALEAKFEILESELKQQQFTGEVRTRMNTLLRDRLNVMLGNVRAPECPKCGKPKITGGIQWLDHAECKRKQDTVYAQGRDRTQNEKGKI